MDDARFDAVIKRVALTSLTRGTALRGLAGGVLTAVLGTALTTGAADAKRKKPKIKPNKMFGCVNVGKFCTTSFECCSNICTGKTGKKTCKAHDTNGCKAGQQEGICGGTDVACLGNTGVCNTTTGNAGYCAADAICVACTTDRICEGVCGLGAACIPCTLQCPGGTACAGLTSNSCHRL